MMVEPDPVNTLDVYLYDRRVGQLHSRQGVLSFQYEAAAIQRGYHSQLSVSLPLQEAAFDHGVTAAFFSGLLPDEGVRHRLARYLQLSERNTFALLKAIGGECAGAVSVYPSGVHPEDSFNPTYRILSSSEAHTVLSELDKRPLDVGDIDVRISGGGAQNKLMVAFVEGNMAIPTRGTPSTHIVKPTISGVEDSVQNEFFCMKLAHAVGLPVPEVDIYWVEGVPYYLVHRYDRAVEPSALVHRLHQEDFCQALHISPEMKYESEGGPSLEDSFALLGQRIASGCMAGRNKVTLFQGVVFNFLIGNGDAHGKNFSILYNNDAEQLAPFYDLMSTAVYSNIHKAKMAMKLGGRYKFKEIGLRHFERLGEAIEFREDFVKKQIFLLTKKILQAATVLSCELNSTSSTESSVYARIVSVIERHCGQLK